MPEREVTKTKNVYLSPDFTLLRKLTSNIFTTALHDFTLIKVDVARFVGTGSFLIRYSKDHTLVFLIKEVS
jgi:hypothetical protein